MSATHSKIIYLDNAATSFPKPPCVYERMEKFLREEAANPGRSGHRMSVEAEASVERARALLARFFHVRNSSRFGFTLNCTDALNMAIKGVIREGDHVITSVLEHNSVLRPLHALEEDRVITLTKLVPGSECHLDPQQVREALTKKTRLVVLTHASNVTGAIQPVREIGKIVREHGALFLVDAAQTAGALTIDVEKDFIDLLAFPGHKSLLGPTGTGGLYVSERVERISPWREGGTGMGSESPVHPMEFPYVLEGGTPNTVGIVGLAEGLKFVAEAGIEKIRAHENQLMQILWNGIRALPKVKTYGPHSIEKTTAALSFNVEGMEAAEVGVILDQFFNVAVRAGLHCAPLAHQWLGTSPLGTVRISPGFFNTKEDIEHFLKALQEIA